MEPAHFERRRCRLARVCARIPPGVIPLAEDKLYKAEYHGSGTFTISKPKRKEHKKRQTKVKNPQRGARRG